MRTFRIYVGVLSAMLAAVLLVSGPLMTQGLISPLFHQRVAIIGTPVILIYVLWTLLRERRS